MPFRWSLKVFFLISPQYLKLDNEILQRFIYCLVRSLIFGPHMFLLIFPRHQNFTLPKEIKFSINDYARKCNQIRRFLLIWSHLLKESIMENFFCVCVVLTEEKRRPSLGCKIGAFTTDLFCFYLNKLISWYSWTGLADISF